MVDITGERSNAGQYSTRTIGALYLSLDTNRLDERALFCICGHNLRGHTFVENRLEQGKAGLKTCYLGSVKTLDIEEIKIKFDREF